MDETSFIYGRTPTEDKRVIVKVSVPRSLKVRLETLKMMLGRNLQDLAAEALEEYLDREIRRLSARPVSS